MQPLQPLPTLDSVAELLDAAVREQVAPGIAASVLVGGALVHESWHGEAQLVPARRPLLPGDVFDVASLTKVVCTTTLCALLVDANDLNLEAPVASLLPAFAQGGKSEITVQHLLAHASGLAGWRPYFALAMDDSIAGRAFLPPAERPHDLAAALERGLELVRHALLSEAAETTPLQRAVYSDPGFMTLGWVLEAVTHESLDRLFATRIAAPLGLADTFFLPWRTTPSAARVLHQSHRFVATENCEHRHEVNCGMVNDDNAWAMGSVAGHAGLFATPGDTARLGQMWLDALLDRPALVSTPTARRFATRDSTAASTRALGWDTPSAAGSSLGARLGRGPRGAIGHLGFTGTSLWVDIDHEVVCVLLTNRVHPSRANEAIKQLRPRFHDTVAAALAIGAPA